MKSNDPEKQNIFTTASCISDSRSWVFSLARQMRDYIRERRVPASPAEVTAAPVEVGELWSKKQSPTPGLLSLLVHALALTIAISSSLGSHTKPKPAAEASFLLEPPFNLLLPSSGPSGGGGGMHASTPASRGVLPKVAEYQLVPPTPIVTNMAPELMAEPTILDVELPRITSRNIILPLGDPNGVVGPPSGGRGTNAGIGDGDDHGVGNRNGPYAGLGDGPGGSDRPVQIGTGGATAPSCPLPPTEPSYTDDARKAHVQGTVLLDVVVNKDGTVSVSRIAQKLGYGLDDEASQFVVKTFRCKPGIYMGQPVATPVRIAVNFHLY